MITKAPLLCIGLIKSSNWVNGKNEHPSVLKVIDSRNMVLTKEELKKGDDLWLYIGPEAEKIAESQLFWLKEFNDFIPIVKE